MKDIKLMTREGALERIALEKNQEGPISFFYKLLADAHPGLVETYENQLIEAIIMGDAMGKSLSQTHEGTPEFQGLAAKLTKMSQKTRIQVEQELAEAMKQTQEAEDNE